MSKALLEQAEFGGINIHPSLLPRYRGAAPIQYALLNGDPVTGVTLFRMESRMDAGEILGQTEVAVAPGDDCSTLHDKLARAAAPLLLRVLDDLEEGALVPRPQDEARVVFAPKLAKRDGAIPWERTAREIERLVRAFSPWPGAFAFYRRGGKCIRLIVTKASVLEGRPPEGAAPGEIVEAEDRIVVACAGGLLEIARLKREGRKEMSAGEFLRGLSLERGAVLKSS
jgi:methionyl-tRNA formyltransferase